VTFASGRTYRAPCHPSAGRPSDAPRLAEAIGASLEHLRPWLAWARQEPSPQAELFLRLDRFARDFDADRDWPFALLTADGEVVVGGAGLHRTGRDDTLEVGCWLRGDVEGLGLASEATAAFCHGRSFRRDMAAVAIRCAVHNVRAVRLAEHMGFVSWAPEVEVCGTTGAGDDIAATWSHMLRRDAVPQESPVRSWPAGYDEEDRA
jgi:RimJ/RimL family protein N-acetyltransferase